MLIGNKAENKLHKLHIQYVTRVIIILINLFEFNNWQRRNINGDIKLDNL